MKTAYPLTVAALAALTLVTAASFTVPCHADPFAPGTSCLPLQDGNVWRYVSTDTPEPVVCEVRARAPEQVPAFIDEAYFVVDGYLFDVGSGSIGFAEMNGGLHEYHGGQLHMFYPWSDQTQPVVIPKLEEDCMHGTAGVFEPVKSITVPAGRFDDVVGIRYTELRCYDGGPASEVFARGVGLVQRRTMWIGGVRTWSLFYAEVNGAIYGDPSVPASRAGTDGRRDPEPQETFTWSDVKARFR